MREILADVTNWLSKNEQVALATVVQTWGSSPRRVGAKMALTPDGKIAGSVSGGCVEAAVFEAGVEVLKTGVPQLLKYGVADDTAWEVGLACGGHIEIFVAPLEKSFFDQLREGLRSRRPFSVASIVEGPPDLLGRAAILKDGAFTGSLGAELDDIALEKTRLAAVERRSQVFDLVQAGENLQMFVDVQSPPPTLIIIGGVHIAIALTTIAKTLGYATVVVDPRRAFANSERFPQVDQLVQAWPQEAFAQIGLTDETAVAVLTHDPKIDDPALKIALDSPAFYIGALGSQGTQAKRRKRLAEDGLEQAQLARLHGPIGLQIGGETPEEIGLAIMSEIVACRHAGG